MGCWTADFCSVRVEFAFIRVVLGTHLSNAKGAPVFMALVTLLVLLLEVSTVVLVVAAIGCKNLLLQVSLYCSSTLLRSTALVILDGHIII